MVSLLRAEKCYQQMLRRAAVVHSSKFRQNFSDFRSPAVVFFGNDEFAVPTLQALNDLHRNGDKKRWRPGKFSVVVNRHEGAVYKYAAQHDLRVQLWSGELASSLLAANQPHIGIVVSFGRLLPKKLIDIFPYGIYNVHASLLPRWRGASPVSHTIRHGDAFSGVTLLQLSPHRFDCGDVLSRVSVPVPGGCDSGQLMKLLASTGAQLLVDSMCNLRQLRAKMQPQNGVLATYARCLTVRDLSVDWRWSGIHVLRHCRSFSTPATTRWRGDRVRIFSLQLPDPAKNPPDVRQPSAGSLLFCRHNSCLLVRCANSWLELKQLQPLGRGAMSGRDFYNGFVSRHPPDQHKFDLITS